MQYVCNVYQTEHMGLLERKTLNEKRYYNKNGNKFNSMNFRIQRTYFPIY